jgi:hypothetical protein
MAIDNTSRLLRGQIAAAVIATCIGLCGDVRADAIYLKERVINSAQPGAPQTPFPDQKLQAYQNPVGFPVACDVASRYPNAFPGVDCSPSSKAPPLMHRALYPASLAPLPGALFSQSQDWSIDPTGNYAQYWNLLYSSNSPGFVYTHQGRYLQFAYLVRHFSDDPQVGAYVSYDSKLYYRVSTNGGQSFPTGQQFRPVIAAGGTLTQPFPMQQIGRDGAAVPGTAYIGKSISGDVLATMSITEGPVPPHVTTYTNGYVLRGKWNQAGDDVTWTISEPARLPASYSTRGSDEPAVLELSPSAPGAVNCILVVRASNEDYSSGPTHSQLGTAGHYWLFRSTDGCATWSGEPTRWGYSDGTPFYAPASNSVFVRMPQNNRIYWIGNISASNSEGNWPRTTLVAAEVDVQSSTPGIMKDSLTLLDKMYGQDTDRVHINNMELALQSDGSAFVFLRRRDEGCPACTSPLSWYSLDIAKQEGVTLSVAPSGASSHVLSWQSSASNVFQYHIRRRYLSGEPLSDAWIEVGTLPGTYSQVTITNYQAWQEAEYEVVAELNSGAPLNSNRVITRFPAWQGPRLSFSFPWAQAPGQQVPLGKLWITWKYDQAQNISHYKLYRRYFDDNGSPANWTVVGDLERERTSLELAGYARTDRFELKIAAVHWNAQEYESNAVSVRFPTAGDPLRPPY